LRANLRGPSITSWEMSLRTDTLDLAGLRLSSGEGRRLDLEIALEPFELGAERYLPDPERVPARLDISRTTGSGYALRLRFQARLAGPCMRCLTDARPEFSVDAREVSQPGEAEELQSPYVTGEPPALLPTAPACAPSAARTSTRPDPSTITTAGPTRAGPNCRSCASTDGLTAAGPARP
jgi:hypothetical protein